MIILVERKFLSAKSLSHGKRLFYWELTANKETWVHAVFLWWKIRNDHSQCVKECVTKSKPNLEPKASSRRKTCYGFWFLIVKYTDMNRWKAIGNRKTPTIRGDIKSRFFMLERRFSEPELETNQALCACVPGNLFATKRINQDARCRLMGVKNNVTETKLTPIEVSKLG